MSKSTQQQPKPDQKLNYAISSLALFACGAVGGVLNILDAGSVAGSIAQVLGYCGAGYYFSRWQSA